MAKRRIPMRHIREVLRLHHEGLSARAIGRSLGLDHTTVGDMLKRARAADLLSWPLPTLSDDARERRLYPGNQGRPRTRPEPDWPRIHADLRLHKGMTLELAWLEYQREHPEDALQYSQFCAHYRRWLKPGDVVLRQPHHPGDKAFVDYAGPTVPIIDRATGETHPAQIFVAVLGYSHDVFAEAHPDQSVASWIQGHVYAFQAFGGVPACRVPDNLKAAVREPHPYEPYLHPSYLEMAQYYDTVVVPAGVRRPTHKAPGETGVQLVERWVLAVLRKRQFFSLAELNAAIAACVAWLNARPFQKWEGSRATLRAHEPLKPLPAQPFEPGTWSRARVHPDYHVQVDYRYYSVPYHLVGELVEVRTTAHTVEIFHQGERVASHPRAARKGQAVTAPEHRPRHHRDR
ncbi:MAG: IS21 family transposase, partial [Firmicutes bacterium]|nr:IS21 family transposase [Bacillota bacterium]